MYTIKQMPEDFVVKEIHSFKEMPQGRFSMFELTKKNYNTEDAIARIAEHLRLPRKLFSYCGAKDRNAITTQLCSVAGKISDLKLKDISVKVIGFSNEEAYVGMHNANEFEIIVRNIDEKPKEISQIINYFDEQRFSKNNMQIGRHIIKREFLKAAELIDDADVKMHLSKHKADAVGAIRKLPYRIQTLLVNAYQSYLWNRAASFYVEKHFKNNRYIEYSLGKLAFPVDSVANIRLPLLSFDTELGGEMKKAYSDVLSEENVSPRDFLVRSLSLTPMGGERDMVVDIINLAIDELAIDELNTGRKKVRIGFQLPKGSYATIVVKRLFS